MPGNCKITASPGYALIRVGRCGMLIGGRRAEGLGGHQLEPRIRSSALYLPGRVRIAPTSQVSAAEKPVGLPVPAARGFGYLPADLPSPLLLPGAGDRS